ncbi:MAG: DUF58 domain-containing protein [Aureliella sp.]
MVRFKLTREGVHFVGVLLFIFFGAVIRDINLLILLAGAMIGLLVLQWRFNVRTLVGVKAARTLTTATTVGSPTNVLIRLSNPKRWLGSWLVLVEDPIQRKKPNLEKSSGTGSLIVDEVRPQGQSEGRYQLTFHQRGVYDIGPTTISTRFPIGLGRGWRTLNNQTSVTVRPKLGQLLPPSRVLFQLELQGSSVASSKSGPNEAEFYGLRPWVTGDSKRWIHWRTTARLGELAVRQFEKQQHQQACLLLDLFQEGTASKAQIEAQEQAIAFVATLGHKSVLTQKGKLAAAICGDHNYVSPIIQSPILVDNLLDELASISPSSAPDIENAIPGISIPLSSNPHLVVVSTRPQPDDIFSSSAPHIDRLLSRITVNWLNVTAGDLEPYFAWTSQE